MIGVFLCYCGTNTAGIVDMAALHDHFSSGLQMTPVSWSFLLMCPPGPPLSSLAFSMHSSLSQTNAAKRNCLAGFPQN